MTADDIRLSLRTLADHADRLALDLEDESAHPAADWALLHALHCAIRVLLERQQQSLDTG